MSLGTCSPRFIPRSESDDFGPRTPSVDSPNRKCLLAAPCLRALPHGAGAHALAAVRTSQPVVTPKDACELLVLTAARSGEVRLATWDEINTTDHVWIIPATRMKANREHRVELSRYGLKRKGSRLRKRRTPRRPNETVKKAKTYPSTWVGHNIVSLQGRSFYEDTGEAVDWKRKRPCPARVEKSSRLARSAAPTTKTGVRVAMIPA